MENGASKLSASKGALKWVAVGAAFAILAPTAVQAAAEAVRVTNEPTIEKINKAVKVTSTGPIKANGTTTVPSLGLFGTTPVKNVMRTQDAPAGFIAGGDCRNDANPLGDAQSSNVVIPADGGKTVITNVIITGRAPLPGEGGVDTPPNGVVYVSTEALGENVFLLEGRVNEASPTVNLDLGPGLALTAPLHLKGRAPDGSSSALGDCQFVAMGYVRNAILAP